MKTHPLTGVDRVNLCFAR